MKRCLILMIVFSLIFQSACFVFANDDVVDVALYQPVVSSSDIDSDHPASLANDGINDNEAYTWWKSADADETPWWQVDLGLGYKLSYIELRAKIGSGEQERNNIRIIASKTADFSDAKELGLIGEEGYTDTYKLEINKKDLFRYVKIEKFDSMPLSIGEFSVYVNQSEILQGAEAVSMSGQIPQTDEQGKYNVPSDVIGTKYEKAVSLLSALNIMRGYPDGDFMPSESITRAEFTTVIARLTNSNKKASSRTYVDVTPEHWAYDAIEEMSAKKIVNGVGEDLFMPDSAITTPQVIKMLVVALGYGEMAEAKGGYPYGYQETAVNLGLYDDVTVSGDVISRGEISLLVYNALSCDVMKVTELGDYVTKEAYKGNTILTEYLNLEKGKGIVTGVSGTSLSDINNKKDSSYLEIDSKQYYSDIPNLSSYLGYNVEYYYEKSDEDKPKVVALIITSKNNVLTIDSKELVDFKDNVLIYDVNENEKADISSSVDVIYNGVARRVYEYSDLLPEIGKVTLIDNNGDFEYDVYVVSSIVNYVVGWVNLDKKIVYSKNAGSLNLDSEENNVTLISKETGEPIELEFLKEWDVISVAQSVNTEGKKVYNAVVSGEFIRGQLEEKGKDYVVIAGRKVGICDEELKNSLELGVKGFFYLDVYQNLVAFDGEIDPGAGYGFLKASQYSETLDDKLEFRILTKNGKFENFVASDKLTINGAESKDKTKVKETLEASGINQTEAQPVYYVINSKGLLTSIETVNGALSLDYDAENEIGAVPVTTTGYYLNVAETFDSVFSYNEETVMVELPPGGELDNEKGYSVITSADLVKSTYYKVQAYDAGEENIAKLLVFSGGASSDAGDSDELFLVDDIMLASNEDGDVLYQVSGLYKGKYESYFISEDVLVNESDFSCGAVMTLAFKGSVISDYEIKFFKDKKPDDAPEFSISEKANECQDGRNSRGFLGSGYLGYGTVTAKKDGVITIDFEGGSGESGSNYDHLVVRLSSVNRVYRFDSEKKEVVIASGNDIVDAQTVDNKDASKVIVFADSGNFREVIILD